MQADSDHAVAYGVRSLRAGAMVVLAVFLQLLILVGALYDTARLCAPGTVREASLLRRDSKPEKSEIRLVARRLPGRIDSAACWSGMRDLAEGHRPTRRRRPGQVLRDRACDAMRRTGTPAPESPGTGPPGAAGSRPQRTPRLPRTLGVTALRMPRAR